MELSKNEVSSIISQLEQNIYPGYAYEDYKHYDDDNDHLDSYGINIDQNRLAFNGQIVEQGETKILHYKLEISISADRFGVDVTDNANTYMILYNQSEGKFSIDEFKNLCNMIWPITNNQYSINPMGKISAYGTTVPSIVDSINIILSLRSAIMTTLK